MVNSPARAVGSHNMAEPRKRSRSVEWGIRESDRRLAACLPKDIGVIRNESGAIDLILDGDVVVWRVDRHRGRVVQLVEQLGSIKTAVLARHKPIASV